MPCHNIEANHSTQGGVCYNSVAEWLASQLICYSRVKVKVHDH